MRWKCGKCNKIFSANELAKQKKVPAVPGKVKTYGYLSRCDCGYTFHHDKWRLQQDMKKDRGKVSTVYLELDHSTSSTGKGVWYETIVFDEDGAELDCRRYCTKAEAIIGHNDFLAEYDVPKAIRKLIVATRKIAGR